MKRMFEQVKRPPLRTVLLLLGILGMICLAFLLWQPGTVIRDGRHDLRRNGIWLQHGWLGDDQWFDSYSKDRRNFRDDKKVQALADLLSRHGIKYVYPHLCPCDSNGHIPGVDPAQTKRFLAHFGDFSVVPWVGGVKGVHCFPEDTTWRKNFVASVVDLLNAFPQLAGVQVNIEPMPTGNQDFLSLLKELKLAVPKGKIISVAAYPPPTRWHQFSDVHWEQVYFKKVAEIADQMAVMMYDSALRWPKLYQHLMACWTRDVIEWGRDSEILLGVPAYDDVGKNYHFADVENITNALRGIHSGLCQFPELPKNYAGIAIYCEWEMTPDKWQLLDAEFGKGKP